MYLNICATYKTCMLKILSYTNWHIHAPMMDGDCYRLNLANQPKTPVHLEAIPNKRKPQKPFEETHHKTNHLQSSKYKQTTMHIQRVTSPSFNSSNENKTSTDLETQASCKLIFTVWTMQCHTICYRFLMPCMEIPMPNMSQVWPCHPNPQECKEIKYLVRSQKGDGTSYT